MSLSIPVDQHTPTPSADSNLASSRGSRRPRNNHGRQHGPNLSTNVEGGASGSDARQPPLNSPSRRGRGRGGNANRAGHTPNRSGGGAAGHRLDESSAGEAEPSTANRPPPQSSRRRQFGSKLTGQADSQSQGATDVTETGDLTERLITSMSRRGNEESIDCPICFISIHPAQPTWSCAPSEQTAVCCWTTFHLKCVRSWASKSTKEIRDAYLARNEDRPGEWRCPGCQTKRTEVPHAYQCFCGRMRDPKPARLATPHSCEEGCSRSKICGHPCSLPCHPGPCPRCPVTVQNPCHCGKTVLTLRCSQLNGTVPGARSCGQVCNRTLACGKHQCQQNCHEGDCAPCTVLDEVTCYCGAQEKAVDCGQGVAKPCANPETGTNWQGKFQCEAICNRPFACGVHPCKDLCHPHSPTTALCPFSPNAVLTCPCGKKLVETLPNGHRTSCTDPIPTCKATCSKPMSCSHLCSSPCHHEACPPCSVVVSIPCRCGETVKQMPCSARAEAQETGQLEVLCGKICGGKLSCGKHMCRKICCPLAAFTRPTKGKKRVPEPSTVDMEGLHMCEIKCSKMLSCGQHTCQQNDHKGPCPPCLEASYEELICPCGRTLLEPPIPCGTEIRCEYVCAINPRPCGHPASHTCHSGDCPPCIHLTTKACACGKATLNNTRCSQEKVSCGRPCGKPLDCGYHTCIRTCHSDDCGACTQVCGKPRRLCLPSHHGCAMPCHAPSVCIETEPCRALVTLHCPCGRLHQQATCGASTSNPVSRQTQALKCSQDCMIAKRNANLAEALGISDAMLKDKNAVSYTPELQTFFRANSQFCMTAERAFHDFVTSDKRTHILPKMTLPRRKFIHDLAEIYRITTQSVDQEPHRSVQLVRRVDTRIPNPVLSASLGPVSRPLGSLGDLRKGISGPSTSTVPEPSPRPANAPRHPSPSLPWNVEKLTRDRVAETAKSTPPIPAPTTQTADDESVPAKWDEADD